MCGVAGLMNWRANSLEGDLSAMGQALTHRGPDDRGLWTSEEDRCGLSHTRLAIIDPSPKAAQPMVSRDGRYVLAYNGEVYNHRDLAVGLGLDPAGPGGDTRVVVEAFSRWGVPSTLRRLSGMFALAVWDVREKIMTLARDPIGIKPLYHGRLSRGIFFASELGSLYALGETPAIRRDAVALLMRNSVIPAPHSIYEGVHKVEPGRMVVIDIDGDWVIKPFADVKSVVREAMAHPFEGNESEAVDALDSALRDSIERHMISDVPLGAFLSGGVDSALVCAIANDIGGGGLNTFTIGFDDESYNEAPRAEAIARHLGTEHKTFMVNPAAILDRVPRVLDHLDEPFADSSQLPTALVSERTRSKVTEALSGDGGDELHGGYPRYRWGGDTWNTLQRLPRWGRKMLPSLFEGLSPRAWDRCLSLPAALGWVPERRMGQKLHRLAGLSSSGSEGEFYRRLVSQLADPARLVPGVELPANHLDDPKIWESMETFEERASHLDLITYLPDDILTKVDRASMQASLEVRVPMLSLELVCLAWSLPHPWRRNKGLLRQVLDRYVPRPLMKGPKTGFGVPIGEALRGVLRPWAGDLLSSSLLLRQGNFNVTLVEKLWAEHLSGRHDHGYLLWNVLVFQHWLLRHHGPPS